MSSLSSNRRIGITLDSRVPKEALILQRLSTLPKTRRQEWFRELLVTGFCTECAEIRNLHAHTSDAETQRYIPTEHSALRSISAVDAPPSPRKPEVAEANVTLRNPVATPITALKAVLG